MPIVIAHDPVGAFMQLQAQQRLDQEDQRQQEQKQRQAQETFRDQMAERQELAREAGEEGRGQAAIEQLGVQGPIQQAQLRQLDQAHEAGTINDDDYDLAKNAVQWSGKGFNPFAEKFAQSGAADRFTQTQQRLSQQQQQSEQSRQQWEEYRGKVAQAGNAVQQAARNFEAVKNVAAPTDPTYIAAQKALNDAYGAQHDLMGQMPAGVPTNAAGNPSAQGGQVPMSQTGVAPQDQDSQMRITPGGGTGGVGGGVDRGGGAPMLNNPVGGTGQVAAPASSPGMSGQSGRLRPTPRSKVRQYMAQNGNNKQAAQAAAVKDGFDPSNVFNDEQPPQTNVRRSAPPINQSAADNQTVMMDPAAMAG